MEQPGRQYTAGSSYRYGFNGKEKDNEISGQGNQYDYGFRIYNPRLGRFLSVDPLMKGYPSISPYPFAMNSPTTGIDLDGLEYLKTSESRININVALFTFNSRTAISGVVSLDPDAVYNVTRAYLEQKQSEDGEIGNRASWIATFESSNYHDLTQESAKAMSSWLKQPSIEDAKAKSLEQEEILVQANKKVPRIAKPVKQRNDRNSNRDPNKKAKEPIPSGVATGSAVADGIMAMVETATYIIQVMNGNTIGSDFEKGKKQLGAVTNVLNDIQFAINTKLIDVNNMENLSGFANYLLDGKEPTITYLIKNNKGEQVLKESTDIKLLTSWKNLKDNISKKRVELSKQSQCVPCR